MGCTRFSIAFLRTALAIVGTPFYRLCPCDSSSSTSSDFNGGGWWVVVVVVVVVVVGDIGGDGSIYYCHIIVFFSFFFLFVAIHVYMKWVCKGSSVTGWPLSITF